MSFYGCILYEIVFESTEEDFTIKMKYVLIVHIIAKVNYELINVKLEKS